jgi:hypothetical protein
MSKETICKHKNEKFKLEKQKAIFQENISNLMIFKNEPKLHKNN